MSKEKLIVRIPLPWRCWGRWRRITVRCSLLLLDLFSCPYLVRVRCVMRSVGGHLGEIRV